MTFPIRSIAYTIASTNHGTMIVNRNDQHLTGPNSGYGVGYQLLNNSNFDHQEINFALAILNARRKHFGDGVVAIDGGANIGVHTIEWARHMFNWGKVISFEAQPFVYYALAGNVAINNCINASPKLSALGEVCGELSIPTPNYFANASFGSLEMKKKDTTEYIGQQISYDADDCSIVPLVSIDSLRLKRLDMVKIDVEGMEIEVLRGSQETLEEFNPIMLIEIIKSDREEITNFLLTLGYKTFNAGINILAIHENDPTLAQIKVIDGSLILSA